MGPSVQEASVLSPSRCGPAPPPLARDRLGTLPFTALRGPEAGIQAHLWATLTLPARVITQVTVPLSLCPLLRDLDHPPNFPLDARTPGLQELVVGESGPTCTELQATRVPFLRGSRLPHPEGWR